MIKINALGKPCPIPVIETKKALHELGDSKEQIEVLVDNQVAVNNIEKLTKDLGIPTVHQKISEERYTVTLSPTGKMEKSSHINGTTVMMIGTKTLGKGDASLGAILMKSYLYSLTELETVPDQMIFFNEGVFLTNQTSEVLKDLKILEDKGAQILSCGTCLDFYEIKEELAIGEISNMFTISEYQEKATKVITL